MNHFESGHVTPRVSHFKSSAHCGCVASRMMQSFWFSRLLWARLQ